MAFLDLSQLDREYLLRWFEYHMTSDDRMELMMELPGTYNRWMGRMIMKATRVDDLPKISRDVARTLMGETAADFRRELTLAKEAAADRNPNEYAYRLLRANGALAQALVYSRQCGDEASEATLVRALDEVMTLADRTRLAFEPHQTVAP